MGDKFKVPAIEGFKDKFDGYGALKAHVNSDNADKPVRTAKVFGEYIHGDTANLPGLLNGTKQA